MSLLGTLHLMTCTAVYLLVGYGAKSLLTTRPAAARRGSTVCGIVLILLSMVLLYEQIR